MFDPVATFERSFTPVDGGYLYYPSRWSGGYLVTEDEFAALRDEWKKAAGWKGIFKLVGLALLGLIAVMAVVQFLGISDMSEPYIGYTMGIPVIAYFLWKGTAPNRLVKLREPVAPPRTRSEVDAHFGRALGKPMAVWIGFISLCFFGWSVDLAFSRPLIGIPLAVVTSIVAFVNVRVALRSFRADS